MSDMLWTVLTISQEANEADVRRMCANKLRGPYQIKWSVGAAHSPDVREIAVVTLRDRDSVLDITDVLDSRRQEWIGGESADMAWRKHMEVLKQEGKLGR